MKIPKTLRAQICAAAVLAAPLALLGTLNEDTINDLPLTKYTEPTFPASARAEGIPDGIVTLAISRDVEGVPGDILVIDSTDPRFAEAAVEAIRQWRFTSPAPDRALPPVLVRIGFRLTGVIYVTAQNKSKVGLLSDTMAAKLREPVRIPELQSLAATSKAINQPMPAYPATLAGKAVRGTAKVHFYVDQDGRVRLPQVSEATAPEFADAALAAVVQWRYEPPRKGVQRIVAAENWAFSFAANN